MKYLTTFNFHSQNLDNVTGRGIIIYSHHSIDKSVIQVQPGEHFEEACFVEIRLKGSDSLLFGCCYRSPTKSATSSENNTRLNKLVRWFSETHHSHKLLAGDFNYKEINWESWTTKCGESSEPGGFVEAIRDAFLFQHVLEPTRKRGSDEPSILDLILTNEELQISSLVHSSPLGKSDHDVILFNYHAYLDETKPKTVRSYGKGDYLKMREELSQENWSLNFVQAHKESNIDDLWSHFKTKLHTLKEKFIPLSTHSRKSWGKGTFPLSQETRKLIKLKNKLHRKWMNSRTTECHQVAKEHYFKIRNKVKSAVRNAKRKYEKDIANDAKIRPKRFWHHARSKLKTVGGISPLLENPDNDKSLRYDDREKAEILQRQYLSVFQKDEAANIDSIPPKTASILDHIVINEHEVAKILRETNTNKSVGPDDIHPRMLVELSEQIAGPVTLLFNKTLMYGTLPNEWKQGYISPIFKKGKRSLASNYRPISLTCILCKILESLVRKAIIIHLTDNNLFSNKQFGFMNGRSTTLQLMHYLDKCVESVAQGRVVDVIFFDFQKAFDMVPHKKLLCKINSFGIRGKLLRWIENFIVGRKQCVVVNGEKSSYGSVLSGIPRGSVLGPLLFVLYINDILDNIRSEGFLFADDTKIFKEIVERLDAEFLQDDIDALCNWSKRWDMHFNADKCHVLTIGRFENIRHAHRYTLETNELEHVNEEKDLGVWVDSELDFSEHISKKVNIANSTVGLIRRSFAFLDSSSFRKLFCAFVRPHIEYAQAIWSPHSQKQIDMIEAVQIRATKLVDGLKNLDYKERLERCQLTTLRFRRLRGDMIEVYKHFHFYDQNCIPPTFKRNTRPSRKHNFQLCLPKVLDGERGVHRNSFYSRIVTIWNELPKAVVDADSLNAFKNRLDEHWMNHPLKYNHKLTS